MKKNEFISLLANLLSNGISLKKTLETVSDFEKADKTAIDSAKYLLAAIKEGRRFSSALAELPIIFPQKYILLVTAAEKTGSLAHIISFIDEEEKFFCDSRKRIINAAVYPLFVVIIAVIGTFLLFFLGGQYVEMLMPVSQIQAYKKDVVSGSVFGFLILFLWLSLFFLLMRWIEKDNVFRNMCRSLSFLSKEGYSLCQSIELTLPAVPSSSNEFKNLAVALSNIRDGMRPSRAFSLSNLFSKDQLVFFEIAEADGSCTEAFDKILNNIDKKTKSRRQFFIKAAEPVLLCGAAFYVMVILQTAIMPLLTGFGDGLL